MKHFLVILLLLAVAAVESKEYPGYNVDEYLKKSKQERLKICNHMKNLYEEAKDKNCHTALNIDNGKKDCLYGEKLQVLLKQRKSDYEFACKI